MKREVTVNGSTYVLDEDMTDAELAAWIVRRNATDVIMERLNARYSCEELPALSTEQIRAEIGTMKEADFEFSADGNKIQNKRHEPPRGLLAFEPKETDFD